MSFSRADLPALSFTASQTSRFRDTDTSDYYADASFRTGPTTRDSLSVAHHHRRSSEILEASPRLPSSRAGDTARDNASLGACWSAMGKR
jgi:hypothetical protein